VLDKIKFAKIMIGLGEIYDKQITEFVADIYYEILKDFDYLKIEIAIRKVISTHKYNTLPKPADILEFLQGANSDKSLIAWYQVLESVKKGGYHASIEFADPIIPHCVNELGGWMWFCCTQKDELPFIQKRFEDLYRLFLKQETLIKNVRLIGFHEARNTQKGKGVVPPIRIGFSVIARQIE